ncbi:MAG: ATP-binding protein, partial [Bacteroidota bacterium]
LSYELMPGESAAVSVLPVYRGPIGVILGMEGGVSEQSSAAVLSLTLPLLRAEQRQHCWQDAFGGHAVDDLAAIKECYHFPSGHIHRVAQAAIAQAGLAQREIVTKEDVRQASRLLNRQGLEMLAAQMEVDGCWRQLVVSEVVELKLRELMQRCRHRERLLDYLGVGFGTKQNRGVRALFTGGSGTGKTLAAKILAAELNMDLYRVDLGAVVNKYVGVTEKNLHQVLSKAEELDVILLLDEGDSLLGNRTDIKSANDRYANLETNYLLQRLENYQGIVVVTTNAAQSIDHAFQRRMDVVINFVAPQSWERQRIWELHLPEQHALAPEFLEQIASRCQLTGGQIRNAALYATLLAMDYSAVQAGHIEEAVRSEYRKAGAICPLDGAIHSQDKGAEFMAFLGVINS